MDINDLNIVWEMDPNNEKRRLLVNMFLLNLLEDNSFEVLKGLRFAVNDKEVIIKTDFNYYTQKGIATLVLNGGKELKRNSKTKEIIIDQPVYHIMLDESDNPHQKQSEGKIKLRTNYLSIKFI